MKKNEKYGVQELDSMEIRKIDGGSLLGGLLAGFLGTFLYEVVEDWDANVAAFNDGYCNY